VPEEPPAERPAAQKLPAKAAGDSSPLLLTEKDWIQIGPSCFWLDIAELERAYEQVRTVAPELLNEGEACSLMEAADPYRGHLLDGWEEDCVRDRERFRALYVSPLEKLVGYWRPPTTSRPGWPAAPPSKNTTPPRKGPTGG
jgi:hypothetical protein